MVSMGAVVYGMVMSALELGVPMAFYAYEKIKNDRANLRRRGRAEGVDMVLAKLSENPGLSPEELKNAVMDDLKNDGRKNGDRSASD